MFPESNSGIEFSEYKPGDKKIPFKVTGEFKGEELRGY